MSVQNADVLLSNIYHVPPNLQFTQRGKTMNPSPFTAELRELEAKQPGTIVFSNIPTDVDTE